MGGFKEKKSELDSWAQKKKLEGQSMKFFFA